MIGGVRWYLDVKIVSPSFVPEFNTSFSTIYSRPALYFTKTGGQKLGDKILIFIALMQGFVAERPT